MPNSTYLIDHWSYSSLKEFTKNRYKFLQVYVLKAWDFKTSPAMLIGKACHKAVEEILNGETVEVGLQAGLDEIDRTKDDQVNWGENGSRAELIVDYTKMMHTYLAEMPTFHKTLCVEMPLITFIEIEGVKMAVPAKSVPDVVEEDENGDIIIHDHKFVSAYTKPDKVKPDYIFQAIFNYHTVKGFYGKTPKKMVYHECKSSKNKDGSPQIHRYTVEFDKYPEYFAAFYRLYDECSDEISREDCKFLPNFSDLMDGEETFLVYASEITGVDRPKVVQFKVEDGIVMEKKYIPSAVDQVQNANLTEEEKIRMKLNEFGIAVEMRETHEGPGVIMYTLKPSRGAKMSLFEKISRDIAIALKAPSVRIEAPIMGTDLVGIEIPNPTRSFVHFDPKIYSGSEGTVMIPIGVDVYGKEIVKDLSEMPHLLVAGATGSGKSVFINVLIQALIAQNTPEQLRLVLIDPKRVELSGYKGDPHLESAPIYETKGAVIALKWLVDEMERRYTTLESVGARNLAEYNKTNVAMPRIVVVIDEFADLMMQTKAEKSLKEPNYAELHIIRLAQKARAVGIHVVLGTQRPSVEVVTGLIKANIPTRIAFATAQRVDSQIILDQAGAESLTGKGDMLFQDPSRRDLIRLQSFYV